MGQNEPRAEHRLEELRADVGAMRALGVIRWRDILLGPPPPPEPAPVTLSDKERADADERALLASRRAHYENLYGRGVTDEELARLP